MSKNLTDKKRLSKIESTRKTFKIFAVSFHGTNLEVMEKELVRQMEVFSSKKIYAVMVNGTRGDQTISEATSELEHQVHQIEEGIRRCKKDFESVWESLTSTLSEDLRRYWSEDVEEVDVSESASKDGDKLFKNSIEEILPKKIKKSDLQILNSEIKDIETCDYFITVFGKFSTEALIKLLLSNQPLQAIIHFIPCPESDLEVNFPKLHKDIDFLRKSPDTKNVGIFLETLIPVAISTITTTTSEYLFEQEEQKYSQQIYDQFTWYLYDIEMLTQQFIVYQTDFVEINDAELPSQEELLWSKFVQVLQVESNKNTIINNNDTAAVGVFLDNLFDAIENRANLDRKNSSCHLSPFVENNYGKIIVEQANELLRSAVANQLNVVTYWKLVNMIVNNMKTSSVRGKHKEIGIELPEFYELLSWESFVQRLEASKKVYDEICRVDMTEECKVFTFRRSFGKVVEVRNKFQLPTRLCLRDFCSCIAPDLANFLRNFEAEGNGNTFYQDFNRISKFSGLVFDDTLKELTVFKKIFRFEDGSISCSVENWSDDDLMVSVRIQLFDNSVYLHPWKILSSESSKIRLVTKNNVACIVEIYQDQLYPNIFLQWPNGCQVQYIHEDNFWAVEQSYHSKHQYEFKRLYTSEGLVIRYLTNDRIEVLTPNGIVYMLYCIDNTSYTDFNFEKSSQEEAHQAVLDEIDFVQNLEKYGIYCEKFEVTLSDGRKLRLCVSGNIVEEMDKFMVYEWMDYCENKKFLDRDDGVKMVRSRDSLRCNYPCGTTITTTVVEDCIRTNFECETNIMDNIFENTNPTFVAKGANKAKRQDSYVTYNLNYLMQHKNYATVEVCGKDKMQIYSPDGFRIILKEDDDDDNHNDNHPVVVVLIDIGEELSFRIAAGVCTILSGVSIPENKQIELKLNLFSDATDILSFQNQNAFLNLYANGEMKLSAINSPCEETVHFLAKHNLFGIEFLSKEKYDTVISNCKNKKYLYNSPTQTVLLNTILPIDEQFSMINPSETENDLKHFLPVVCHGPKSKPDVSDRIFTARIINKLKNPVLDTLTFIKNLNFNETTLGNQLNAALSHFFGEKMKPVNPKWKIKINEWQEDSLYKKHRKRIYNAMLKHNIFPKYYEFKNSNDDVKLLNVDKLVQLNNLK